MRRHAARAAEAAGPGRPPEGEPVDAGREGAEPRAEARRSVPRYVFSNSKLEGVLF